MLKALTKYRLVNGQKNKNSVDLTTLFALSA